MNRRTEATTADALPSRPVGHGTMRRRTAIKALGLAGVALGSCLDLAAFAGAPGTALGDQPITPGDIAMLKFLAAAELLETDLWVQYQELAAGNPSYADALSQLDGDMVQYIMENTDDELSHATFLNAYLASVGAQPVNLDAFRTLPSSPAKGAAKTGRLTNLTALTVDTSWWLRYRATGNPDFGDTFPQLINIVNQPAIPLRDNHTKDEMQAIANVAGFHFATIEQGGSSLYASFAPKATNLDVLRIIIAIGGTEVNHFGVWHDLAGNAPPVTANGVVFPDLSKLDGDESRQKNLIFPEPCKFVRADLPACSVIRPTSTQNAGAVAAATGLTKSGLFAGQSKEFFSALNALATAADQAVRGNLAVTNQTP